MEITNEMKHNIFKREVSAMILESASWNDNPLEVYKDVSMEVFLADYFTETLTEMCPECETEVELVTELKWQVCPSCGKPIAPCGICDMDFVKCSDCPLGCNKRN